ncbi:hypothetical protein [Salmonella phage SD-2_S15]|nr:hypothetical protein [Salmonella phage SD-2_S15]
MPLSAHTRKRGILSHASCFKFKPCNSSVVAIPGTGLLHTAKFSPIY